MEGPMSRRLLVPLTLAVLALPQLAAAQVEFLALGDLGGGVLRSNANQIAARSGFVVGEPSSGTRVRPA